MSEYVRASIRVSVVACMCAYVSDCVWVGMYSCVGACISLKFLTIF